MYKIFISICFLLLISSCSRYKYGIIEQKILDLTQNKIDIKSDYLKSLDVPLRNNSYLLYNQEAGKIAFILDDTGKSIKYFNNAIMYYNNEENISKYNIKDGNKKILSSTISDDNILEYKGSEYERAFVHFYQALNYLKGSNKEKSLVEIRAANDAQRLAIVNRENRISSNEDVISKYTFSNNIQALLNAQNMRSELKSKFLNAYIYYVSGHIREISGDNVGALVDYKNAHGINPNNQYLIQDLLRLSSWLDVSYFNELSQKHKINWIKQEEYQKQKTIFIAYEDKFIPPRKVEEGSILFFFDDAYAKISLPVYGKEASPSSPYVVFNNKTIAFEDIANINLISKNQLSENYNGIIARQISRLLSKYAMQNSQRKISSSDSNAKQITSGIIAIAGLVSSIVERADTRSFETLPQYTKVVKINTTEDIKNLSVSSAGRHIDLSNIKLNNSQSIFIYIMDSGLYMYYSIIDKTNK